jgi:hypothetical protein
MIPCKNWIPILETCDVRLRAPNPLDKPRQDWLPLFTQFTVDAACSRLLKGRFGRRSVRKVWWLCRPVPFLCNWHSIDHGQASFLLDMLRRCAMMLQSKYTVKLRYDPSRSADFSVEVPIIRNRAPRFCQVWPERQTPVQMVTQRLWCSTSRSSLCFEVENIAACFIFTCPSSMLGILPRNLRIYIMSSISYNECTVIDKMCLYPLSPSALSKLGAASLDFPQVWRKPKGTLCTVEELKMPNKLLLSAISAFPVMLRGTSNSLIWMVFAFPPFTRLQNHTQVSQKPCRTLIWITSMTLCDLDPPILGSEAESDDVERAHSSFDGAKSTLYNWY